MTKVHTPEPEDEHSGAAGALAGSLLNKGTTSGLEATSTRTPSSSPRAGAGHARGTTGRSSGRDTAPASGAPTPGHPVERETP